MKSAFIFLCILFKKVMFISQDIVVSFSILRRTGIVQYVYTRTMQMSVKVGLYLKIVIL
jgi:hypothetical protein